MSVKIRMTRMGRRHRPYYRINVVDSRTPRDGRIIEKVGHYDPIEKNKEKQVLINAERIQYWLDNGAIPSDTVAQILARHGIESKHYQDKVARRARARAIARKQGKPFTEGERIAAKKAAEAEQAAKEAAKSGGGE